MASYLVFVCIVFYFIVDISVCFNIDSKFPLVFNGPRNSYFGFSAELYRNREGPLALITAPKANSSYAAHIHQPGVLYKCRIGSVSCQEVVLPNKGGGFISGVAGSQYVELKEDMLLGISLDIEPKQDGNIVTCGHLWKNNFFRETYLANGACYVINSNFRVVHHLLPLLERQKQTIPGINFYAHGMAGFSVSYTMDGEDLLLGSPGVYEGKGSIADYNVLAMEGTASRPIIPNPQDVPDDILGNDAYVGYSVTSGKFGGYKTRSIVSGAPRCGDDRGCVYLFEELSDKNKQFTIQDVKFGEKMGDYFGATVLGVNINNDEYTDLLVGAPFYSTEHSGDEGRAYVFMGSEIALDEVGKKLEGSRHPNARFGTAISSVGDLNWDGFTDIAVGAPYEEGVGAIYIFHGSQEGIVNKYVQRITPTDMKINTAGFGISISKGKDIDDNAYPDILVGAYDTANAVLLRSKPIIQVYPKLEFDTKQVKINSTTCNVNGKEESCFDLRYCFKYSGHFVPEKVDMKVHLTVDVHRKYQPRCYFIDENQHVLTKSSEITIQQYGDNCYDRKVYIEENIQDFLTPILFNLTHELKSPQSLEFCKTCPIIDQNTPKTILEELVFWTGCGEDNECLSDVKLHVSFNIGDGEPLIVGKDTVLVIDITIENTGDPAFQTELNARLPENIEIINQADCTSDKKSDNITLNCKIANPLYSEQPARLQLKLDTSKVSSLLKHLEFEFWTETTSNETKPANNYVTRIFPVVVKAAIIIKGSANNEVIFITDESEELIPIKHTYVVSKNMPSPIAMADITLSIPIMLPSSKTPFLEINDFTMEHGKENIVPYICNNSTEDFGQFNKSSDHTHLEERADSIPSDHPDHSGLDTVTLDCSNVICKTFKCVAGPFTNKRKSVLFEIVGTINFTKLEEQLGKRDAIVIVSEGTAEIQDKFGAIEPSQRKSSAKVTNILERKGLHSITPANYWWIILVSVLAGIILFILIILLLIKFGFFRRKEQEEMERMAHEERLEKKEGDEERVALYNGSST